MWLQEDRPKVYKVVCQPNVKILVAYQDPPSILETRSGLVTSHSISKILYQIIESSATQGFVDSFFKFQISVDVCE